MNTRRAVYVCPDAVVLEPASADPAVPRETLVILRDTGEIKLNAPYSGRHDEAIACYGVLGMIRLNGGEHLVIVTDRLRVGRLGGNDIFKMAAYRVLPLRTQSQSLTEQQAYDDGQYLAMLEEMLGLDGYYFSSTHHITHSLQRIAGLADGPMWKLADDRFFFNRYLASRLIDASAGNQDVGFMAIGNRRQIFAH